MVMGRLLRRARTGVWLCVLLAVPPVALIRYVGFPLPRHWPTRAQWEQWVAQPLTGGAVIDLFAITVWLAWAVLAYAVLVDLTGWIGRLARRGPRLRLPPLPAALQATANGILGAAVLGAGTHPAHPAAAARPPTAAAATHHPASATQLMPVPPADPLPGVPQQRPDSDADRVILPDGGWVTGHTAAAVAVSAALLWRQRRLRYLPGPLRGAARDDPDLTPLPATVTTIQAQLHPPPDSPSDPTGGRPPTDPIPDDPGPAVLGHIAGRALRPTDLPAGGVALTGPAALDAARGILVAAILTGAGATDDPRLVITGDDLTTLLGPAPIADHDIPGLRRAHDIHDAINTVEAIALRRAADRYPHPPGSGPPGPHPTSTVTLITASPPEPATIHRLTVLLTLAAQVHVTGVLLGPWPHRTTWHVKPGGIIHRDNAAGTPVARLSVLNTTATGDLLTLYRDAHQPATLSPHACPAPPRRPVSHDHPSVAPTGPSPHTSNPWFPADTRVRLRVLGHPAVYPAASTTPIRLPRSAALPILVLLALYPDGLTTTDVTTTLWPQLHSHTTASRVYTTINTLRRTLDPIAGGPTVVRAADRYRLNPHHVDVDLWKLHTAVNHAAHSPTDRSQALQQIIDTYTGDLADGWPWPWLDAHREAVRRHLLDAHAALTNPAAAAPPP
jgi:hypothetical protein